MTNQKPPRLPSLDPRLQGIAQLVPVCETAADIGCDHGRLGLHLLASGKCRHVLFADISADSLNKARKLLALHRLEERAAIVVADGLAALVQPVDAIIISGLGGQSILDILKQGYENAGSASLVLSAQTETPLLRTGLIALGYALVNEAVIHSRGRYYTALLAEKGSKPHSLGEKELYVGCNLVAFGGATIEGYLRWRLNVLLKDRGACPRHIRWLKEEIERASSNESVDL